MKNLVVSNHGTIVKTLDSETLEVEYLVIHPDHVKDTEDNLVVIGHSLEELIDLRDMINDILGS